MQHCSGAVNEEFAQVSSADQLGLSACRDLPRHEAEPCGKIAPLFKAAAGADSGDERRRNRRADAGDLHQPLHIGIRPGQCLDLGIDGRNPAIDHTQL